MTPHEPLEGALFRLLSDDEPLARFAAELLEHVIEKAVARDHDFVAVAQVLANLTGKTLAIGLYDPDGGPRFTEVPHEVLDLLRRLAEAGFEIENEALGP